MHSFISFSRVNFMCFLKVELILSTSVQHLPWNKCYCLLLFSRRYSFQIVFIWFIIEKMLNCRIITCMNWILIWNVYGWNRFDFIWWSRVRNIEHSMLAKQIHSLGSNLILLINYRFCVFELFVVVFSRWILNESFLLVCMFDQSISGACWPNKPIYGRSINVFELELVKILLNIIICYSICFSSITKRVQIPNRPFSFHSSCSCFGFISSSSKSIIQT